MQQRISDILGKAPFIRFTVPLLAGIAFAEIGIQPPFSALWVLIPTALIYLLLSGCRKSLTYSFRWLWGALAFTFLFFSGITLWQQQKRASELPLAQLVLLDAVVIEHPVQKPKTIQLQLYVNAYRLDSSWVKTSENVVVYLQADSTQLSMQAGQRIIISANLQPINPPMNPEEFDYRRYMQQRGYYATAFVSVDACEVVEENALPFYKTIPLRLQQGVLNVFKQANIAERELAVLMALTIGDKQLLDDDLKQAYSSAGVIHILAVSGLHVGLLYVLLTYMLFFLKGKRYKVILKTVLILVCLWLYAAIADFSPSVTRATIMFSFILFAQLSGRRASTLNAVFASAFFICLFKPLSLFDVGFQLSYLAVLGILAFYPKLSKLVTIRNPLLRGVWNICCVSLAAQLAVLPLSVFYFHQLPVYFLLTNILVLPLVTVATYLIVLLLLVSFIPLLSAIVGYILGACIWIITYVVEAVQQLPYAVWSDIYISPLQLSLYLLALLCFMLVVYFKKKLLLLYGVVCFILALSLGIAHNIETKKQKQLVVFNTSNASFVSFIEGHKATCLRDDRSKDRSFGYNTNGYFIKQRVSKYDIQTIVHSQLDSFHFIGDLRYYKNFFWFAGQRIKLLDSLGAVCPKEPFPVDILIVSSTYKGNINEVFSHYFPGLVVIDSSVSGWKMKEWEALLGMVKIPYYNVREKGAFVLNVR